MPEEGFAQEEGLGQEQDGGEGLGQEEGLRQEEDDEEIVDMPETLAAASLSRGLLIT